MNLKRSNSIFEKKMFWDTFVCHPCTKNLYEMFNNIKNQFSKKGHIFFVKLLQNIFIPMGILSEKSKHFKSVLTSFSEKCLNGLIQYNLSSCSIYVSLLSDGKLTQKQCDKSFYTLYDVQKFSVCLNPNENLASTLTFTFTKALYSCLKLSLPYITQKVG